MDRRAFTPEDFWALKTVGDVQLSPDGMTVAYVVGTYDEAHDAARSAIWLADRATGSARQVTSGEAADSQPRWSPDCSALAFISTRHNAVPQVFIIAVAGGEARQLTHEADGVQSAIWSPDGTRLCYVAAPETARQKVPQEVDWFAAHPDADQKAPRMRRQTTLTSRFDGRGYIDRRSHLFVIDVAAQDTPEIQPRQLTDGDYDDLEPAWSPDGTSIAFISNRTSEAEHTFTADVWTVSVAGGELRCLTNGELTAASPAWSPDGATIAFYAGPEAILREHFDTHVWTVSRTGGDQRDASAALDRSRRFMHTDYLWPQDTPPLWSPDGRTIYFLAVDGGDSAVFALDRAGGAVARVSRTAADVAAVQCTPDGRTLVCLASTPEHPYDIFTVPSVGGELRLLVESNQALLDRVTVAAPEYFTFQGADGWDIDGWIYKPVARADAQPYPLILVVHGGPHAAWPRGYLFQAQILAGAGYAALYINPRGSLGYGQAFARAADWGEKDYGDLMAGVDAVLASGEVDTQRLGVTGLSYGGFMTNWVLGHTDRFAAGVAINGVSNMVSMFGVSDIGIWCQTLFGGPFWAGEQQWQRYRHHSPISYVDRISAPLLLIQAENDYRCPIDQGEQMLTALRVRRKTVELIRVPGASHAIAASASPHHRYFEWRLVKEWFDTYIKHQPQTAEMHEEAAAAVPGVAPLP